MSMAETVYGSTPPLGGAYLTSSKPNLTPGLAPSADLHVMLAALGFSILLYT
jgi:hypothetical protein